MNTQVMQGIIKFAFATCLILALIVVLSGCGDSKQSVDHKAVDAGPADVVAFPRGFRNVAKKCDGPNMVYSASRGNLAETGGAVAVVPQDPRCPGTGSGG